MEQAPPFIQEEKHKMELFTASRRSTHHKHLRRQHRLRSHFQPPCPRDTTDRLSALPVELIHGISSHLPLSSQASLGLTCRRLYSAAASAHPNVWESLLFAKREPDSNPLSHVARQERLMFLRQFDVEYPNHLLCEDCALFHKRLPTLERIDGWKAKPDGMLVDPCRRQGYSLDRFWQTCLQFHADMHLLMISRTLVQLVHRGVRLGLAHGISPDALSRKVQLRSGTLETKAIISDGRLLLRITKDQEPSPYAKPSPIVAQTIQGKRCTCSGIYAYFSEEFQRASTCPELRQKAHAAAYNECVFETAICHCSHCPSEYQLRLMVPCTGSAMLKRFPGYHIQLVCWIDLGTESVRKDKCWKRITEHSRKKRFDWTKIYGIVEQFDECV